MRGLLMRALPALGLAWLALRPVATEAQSARANQALGAALQARAAAAANATSIAANAAGIAASTASIPRNTRRLVVFGDSFDDTYGCDLTASHDYQLSASTMAWLQVLSGGLFDYNCTDSMRAVGGQTSTYILNTANGGAAAVLDATKAGTVIWQPGTNDATNGIPPATTIANDKAFLALAAARGVKVVLDGIAPRGGYTDNPVASVLLQRKRWIAEVNAWRQAAAKLLPNVAYADTSRGWSDPTSAAFSPVPYGTVGSPVRTDQLHPSDGIGGYYLARANWVALQSLGFRYAPDIGAMYFDSAYDPTDNPWGNRLANQTFYQTSAFSGTGGLTGSYPAGWPVSHNAGTVVTLAGSQVARPDGYPGTAHQFVFNTPASAVATANTTSGSTTIAITGVSSGTLAVGNYIGGPGLTPTSITAVSLSGGTGTITVTTAPAATASGVTLTAAGAFNEQFRAEKAGQTAFVVGEKLVFSVSINVQNPIGFRVPLVYWQALDAGGATLFSCQKFDATGAMPNESYTGPFTTDPCTVPANTASIKLRILLTTDGTVVGNGATVQIFDPYLERLPAKSDVLGDATAPPAGWKDGPIDPADLERLPA